MAAGSRIKIRAPPQGPCSSSIETAGLRMCLGMSAACTQLKGGSHTYRCHAASPWHHKCLAAASICCQDQKLLYACLKLELSLHYRLISSALSKKHTVQGAWNIPKLLKWSMPCTPRWLKNHHLAAMTALLQRSICCILHSVSTSHGMYVAACLAAKILNSRAGWLFVSMLLGQHSDHKEICDNSPSWLAGKKHLGICSIMSHQAFYSSSGLYVWLPCW